MIIFYQVRIRQESMASLGVLWGLSAQRAPRKAVDPGFIILLDILSNFHLNSFFYVKIEENDLLKRRQLVTYDRFERENVNLISRF